MAVAYTVFNVFVVYLIDRLNTCLIRVPFGKRITLYLVICIDFFNYAHSLIYIISLKYLWRRNKPPKINNKQH